MPGADLTSWPRSHQPEGAAEAFKDWTKVFPDPLDAQVITERFTELSEVLIDGRSYRDPCNRARERLRTCPASAIAATIVMTARQPASRA
jgi:hypothetical protein